MEKFAAIVRIGYTTKRQDLPGWATSNMETLGGPGFTMKGQTEQYRWYDYVAKLEDGKVIGIRNSDIENIVHNANLINAL